MRILIAPDSFKESLTAPEVAHAIAAGLRREWPEATYTLLPLADGGEGTVDTMVSALGGQIVDASVHDPLMRPIVAQYGLVNAGRTAVIEVAAASGLHLVAPSERDALRASSYGTGELMRDALDRGLRHFVVGLGGSATTDGGLGMAQALGVRFMDAQGNELPCDVSPLLGAHSVNVDGIPPALKECVIDVACDVTNPLCGSNGAAQIYGPQKGARPSDIKLLDEALEGFYPEALAQCSGAGAAGGLGAAFLHFAPATLASGFDIIADCCALESAIQSADLVVTGEGKIDAQTGQGKVPSGVARMAHQHHKPVIAFCATVDAPLASETSELFQEIIAIDSHTASRQDALDKASTHLSDLAQQYARANSHLHPSL